MTDYELVSERRSGADVRPDELRALQGERRVALQDRRAPRQNMLKGVRISFNNESSFLEAVLRNLSETGCFIELPDGYLIPDRITVHNDLDGYKIECEVVRRQGDRIGAKFIGERIPVGKPGAQEFNSEVPDLARPSEQHAPANRPAQPGALQRRKAPVFGKLGTPRH